MENKAETVVEFYTLCNKLKQVIRTGWKDWNVKADRLESVAEHIYSTQMLAIAMASQYGYEVDIYKVVIMLAVHELEEIVIGDLTQFQITREEKSKLGHEAIAGVLKDIIDRDKYIDLIMEFDARETAEAKFAYWCDKLDADLQARLYDLDGLVDVSQVKTKAQENKDVKTMLDKGYSWSEMWMTFGQMRYGYDDNFLSVSQYAKKNNIAYDSKKGRE